MKEAKIILIREKKKLEETYGEKNFESFSKLSIFVTFLPKIEKFFVVEVNRK